MHLPNCVNRVRLRREAAAPGLCKIKFFCSARVFFTITRHTVFVSVLIVHGTTLIIWVDSTYSLPYEFSLVATSLMHSFLTGV